MNKDQFLSVIAKEKETLDLARQGRADETTMKRIDVCSSCGKILGMKAEPGEERKEKLICEDCRFEELGTFLDGHPITALRVVRMK